MRWRLLVALSELLSGYSGTGTVSCTWSHLLQRQVEYGGSLSAWILCSGYSV